MRLALLVCLLLATLSATLAFDYKYFEEANLVPIIEEQHLVETSFPFQVTIPDDVEYRYCTDIAVLGNTCLELYAIERNLTIGARLIIRGYVVLDEYVSGENVCLNQKTLLQLLELIPGLAPFKPLIDKIIRVEGYIPAKLFSVCLKLRDIKFSKESIEGCASLDSTLMCWKKSCLQKGSKELGCFDIKKTPRIQ